MSALEEIFFGECPPFDVIGRVDSADQEKINSYFRACDAFKKKIDSSLHGEVDTLFELHADCNLHDNLKSFIEGYRLGSRVMLEVFSEKRII